jgi:hypothetical protein
MIWLPILSLVGDIIVRSFNGLGRRRWTSEVVCRSQARVQRFPSRTGAQRRRDLPNHNSAARRLSSPAGVELGRASMPAVAAFTRFNPFKPASKHCPGSAAPWLRRIRNRMPHSDARFGFAQRRRCRIGKLNSVRFRTDRCWSRPGIAGSEPALCSVSALKLWFLCNTRQQHGAEPSERLKSRQLLDFFASR